MSMSIVHGALNINLGDILDARVSYNIATIFASSARTVSGYHV